LRSINTTSNQLKQFPVPINNKNIMEQKGNHISTPEFPPLSFSLITLFVANNPLTKNLNLVLYFIPILRVLNASYNSIIDITSWFVNDPQIPLINQFPFSYNTGNQTLTN